MVEPSNKNVSISRQCTLLSISRSGWYYELKGESPLNLHLMRLIDEQFLATPYYGSRQMARQGRGAILALLRVACAAVGGGLKAIPDTPARSGPLKTQ